MLACDGVWDALDESEVFEAVRLFTLAHSVTGWFRHMDAKEEIFFNETAQVSYDCLGERLRNIGPTLGHIY
jgi:serine/threonine protein phosphatase PrpC